MQHSDVQRGIEPVYQSRSTPLAWVGLGVGEGVAPRALGCSVARRISQPGFKLAVVVCGLRSTCRSQ
jgi:hypothetical protein